MNHSGLILCCLSITLQITSDLIPRQGLVSSVLSLAHNIYQYRGNAYNNLQVKAWLKTIAMGIKNKTDNDKRAIINTTIWNKRHC